MSPESGMLDELRFELLGRKVVAYLAHARRRADPARGALPPTRWSISLEDGPAFDGPIYHGYQRSEAPQAEAELRAFLEQHPRLREPD